MAIRELLLDTFIARQLLGRWPPPQGAWTW
jgi:hypothetical protein